MKVLVNIDVPDLEKALAFYQAALGLTHSRSLDSDVAELTGAGCVIYLLEKAAGSTASSTGAAKRDYARHRTPVHVDFVVDNLEEAMARALAAGARQESEPVDWLGSRCATFSDPFGNGFCLIRFAGETYGG